MKANWIKQTTATTGTGPITLGAAVTGFTAISDHPLALPDGSEVRYQVIDGNDRAEYIGTYTAAGTVLSIDTVVETLVSGVYDNTSPAALSLSGSAVVILAHSANITEMSGVMAPSNASYLLLPHNVVKFDGGGIETTANRITYTPAWFLFPTPITELGFIVRTADAASVDTRVGIWDQDPTTAQAANNLYGSGHIDVSTTGRKTEALPSPLILHGIYWFGMKSDSATLNVSVFDPTDSQLWGHPLGIGDGSGKAQIPFQDPVVGVMPSVATINGYANYTDVRAVGFV